MIKIKEYLEHLRSWKEEAGRQEMIGFEIICGLLPVGFGLLTLLIVMFFDFLFIGSETGYSPWTFLVVIYPVEAVCLAALSYATIRRLNNIGLPRKLAYLLVLLIIPYVRILGFLFLIYLMICPPLKKTRPNPYTPTYFKEHVIVATPVVLVPAILVIILALIIGDNNAVFSGFPVLNRWYKVKPRPVEVEEVQVPEGQEGESDEDYGEDGVTEETEIPPEIVSDDAEYIPGDINLLTFPMYTDPNLIVRYEGQNAPAYVSAQTVPNENKPGDFVLHLTWDTPDVVPIADRTAWNTEKLRSCGDHCKQMPSMDGKKIMRISLDQKQNLWVQSVGRKEGLIEYVSFDRTPKHAWQEFVRYRQNKRVQVFISDKTKPELVRFFDIGLQNGVLFPLKEETLWLLISPNGSISPIAVQNKNPSVQIPFPREEFAQYWPGVHPTTKWLKLMFPEE